MINDNVEYRRVSSSFVEFRRVSSSFVSRSISTISTISMISTIYENKLVLDKTRRGSTSTKRNETRASPSPKSPSVDNYSISNKL